MGTCYIRDVDNGAISKIDQLAKKKHISRNEFLKQYIETLSIIGDLKDLDSKYAVLVKSMSKVLEENIKIMASCKRAIDELKEKGVITNGKTTKL